MLSASKISPRLSESLPPNTSAVLDFNRQHPFVDILYADIIESGETLDVGQLPGKTSP